MSRPGVPEAPLFALLERGAPLLLTSLAAAAPIGRRSSTLRCPTWCRAVRALLAFALWAPDEALLMALAVKLFADRQLVVPESVVTHLVRSLERSPAALRDFIARADARALAEKKPVNLQLIQELLDLMPAD